MKGALKKFNLTYREFAEFSGLEPTRLWRIANGAICSQKTADIIASKLTKFGLELEASRAKVYRKPMSIPHIRK